MAEKNECEICKTNIDVDLPQDIIDAIKSNNLVIFCGAGISTENPNIMPYSFYEKILDELGSEDSISFSKLMSKYCELPNGRIKLVREIFERFNYINSFPELKRQATRFHRTLSTIPQIDTIITTNWDMYFEEYCDAIPFVYPEDIPLWESSKRRVLKIHGSINNISSLVATEEDYRICFQKLSSGVFSSKLIDLLSTKTVVFIGFSFSDEDFQQILSLISLQTGKFMPHIFIVTLDESLEEKMKEFDITSIITDGTFFLEMLREYLVKENILLSLNHYQNISIFNERCQELHGLIFSKDYFKKFPLNIYSLAYQDGIIHAFERLQNDKMGQYYDPIYLHKCIRSYEDILNRLKATDKYIDIAYIEGYLNALILFATGIEGIEPFPFFYLPTSNKDIVTIEEYKKNLSKTKNVENKYMSAAKSITKTLMADGNNLHHRPIL